MEKNIKEPVRLRRKALANGNESLYLDIYMKGRRRYEFLRLYLVPERSREDREKNRQTMRLANSVKAMRLVEVQNGEYGFKTVHAEHTLFYDYFVAMAEKRDGSGSRGNWRSCLNHLERYDPNLKRLTFAGITPKWVQGFRDYLEDKACAWERYSRERVCRPLSRNSRALYFRELGTCLNRAYEEGIIASNPMRGIEGFRPEEGRRMYLTVEEVKRLARTECEYPNIKRAFLFSCLTGLRRSDILKLTWGEVQRQGEFTRLVFRQKKTGGQEYLDISPQAAELLGERGKSDEHPFTGILTPKSTNEVIKRWVRRTGIQKEISFHCGRHTFAVMMLDLGTDIYTVSKLLGHRALSTTQIYAKVLDKNKQAAVSRIPDIFGE